MKKILGVGLVGAAVIGAVVIAKGASPAATPEGKACIRVSELCGVDDRSAAKLESCVADLEKAKKLAGPANVDRSVKCIEESNSCAAVTGCMMGGVGMGAMGEMMKGFGSALSR
ncbi:MAG TPA: hypothetical protein VLT33_36385 [Labilithrix sp.]|jgi:hypothetical protein|nr:hypothetical protein [Labilithrix sp.]